MKNGNTDRNHETNIHAYEDNSEESSHANDKIKFVNFEEMNDFFVMNESKHGRYDNDWESNHRGVAK